MEVTDLTKEYEDLYSLCLEDWSDEMREAGGRKAAWYAKVKDRGLRVKLARGAGGEVGGMIHYLPIERSFAEGEGLYFVLCIWVHGYKQGRGDFQRKGMGKALLRAAEDDARKLGAKGMAAWGLWLPFWMKASWFRRQGYRKADRRGLQVLLWKPFTRDAVRPRWLPERNRKPETTPGGKSGTGGAGREQPGKVTVTSFVNGWCPAQNLVYERAKRAAAEFGDRVFQEIDTFDREAVEEWGISDALFVDGREVRTGPPPSYEKIRKLIAKRVRKL